MIFIGIDPGATGAVVAIDENGQFLSVYYHFNGWHGLKPYLNQFKPESTKVYLEKVQNIFGVSSKSNFLFGQNYGISKGFLYSQEFDFELVHPKIWQKAVFEGIPEIREEPKKDKNGILKKGKLLTKKMAIEAKIKYFNDVDLRKTTRSTKDDPGAVDALLIAYYGYLQNKDKINQGELIF